MQRCHPLALIAFLALLLAGTGCGSSSSSTSSAAQVSTDQPATTASSTTATTDSSTTTESAQTANKVATEPPSTAHLTLSSPVFQAGRSLGGEGRAIPTRYTCDGTNTSPPMRWSGVPKGTSELVLLILGPIPAAKRPFAWAVGGLAPSLHAISAGRLPTGAVVGRNSAGRRAYSVCPPRGRPYTYAIFLYALRHKRGLKPGFDPNALYEEIGGAGLPQGQSGFAYKRG